MRRYGLVLLMLAIGGMVWAAEGEKKVERQTGELSGVVVGTEAVKEEGVLRLALTITTETGAKETFIVGPANQQAYATVGSLKAGEKVRLAWVTEGGDKKWIRSIRRLEGTEGERKTEEPRKKTGEGDRPR